MNETQTKERLIEVFAEVFHLERDSLPENPTLGQLAEWDSLAHIRLIMAVEEAFGLQFQMEVIPKLISFEALLDELQHGK